MFLIICFYLKSYYFCFMHELSIVIEIIKIVKEAVDYKGEEKVESVELEIGTLAGIQREALEFAWASAVKGTILEGAKCIIKEIPAQASCLECGCQYNLEHWYDECPQCGSYFRDIIQGKEMRVKSIEI